MSALKILISGGGSGGHVFPAIAIANALKEKHPDTHFLFVGAKDKIEMEKVPKAGYEIEGLWISGFHRKLTLRNLMFPIKVLTSLWKASRILNRFKPDVVVGVGGFASGPVLKMATRKNYPTLIQEQNSYPGLTNRLLAKDVDKICVAYDGLDRFFPAEKIVKTGNPVRQDFLQKEVDKKEAYQYFGLDGDKKTIFMFGGSLGAQSMNEAMAANALLLKKNPNVQVLWQVGKLYYERFQDGEVALLPNVQIRSFVDRMDLAYAIADVMICRAGAMTIAELCLVGKPAIFIPSPNVAEDHQTANAKALSGNNAAVLIKDKEAKKQIIEKALEVLDDEILSQKLSQNIRQLAIANASDRIALEVLQLVKRDDES